MPQFKPLPYIVLFIGIGLSILAFKLVFTWSEEHDRQQTQLELDGYVIALEQRLSRNVRLLEQIRGLFNASRNDFSLLRLEAKS